jgi:DNA-dependent RNA polymerase auxiliary subunit epsilon
MTLSNRREFISKMVGLTALGSEACGVREPKQESRDAVKALQKLDSLTEINNLNTVGKIEGLTLRCARSDANLPPGSFVKYRVDYVNSQRNQSRLRINAEAAKDAYSELLDCNKLNLESLNKISKLFLAYKEHAEPSNVDEYKNIMERYNQLSSEMESFGDSLENDPEKIAEELAKIFPEVSFNSDEFKSAKEKLVLNSLKKHIRADLLVRALNYNKALGLSGKK